MHLHAPLAVLVASCLLFAADFVASSPSVPMPMEDDGTTAFTTMAVASDVAEDTAPVADEFFGMLGGSSGGKAIPVRAPADGTDKAGARSSFLRTTAGISVSTASSNRQAWPGRNTAGDAAGVDARRELFGGICPAGYVDCVNGNVRGTVKPCAIECAGKCCIGNLACYATTACIKKDGSCDGDSACNFLGFSSPGFGKFLVSGPSCVGISACADVYLRNTVNAIVIIIRNSCLCKSSCLRHCSNDPGPPSNLSGLPACGQSIINFVGSSNAVCAPSAMPSGVPPSAPPSNPSDRPSNVPSDVPSNDPSTSPSTVPSVFQSASSMPSASPSFSPSPLASSTPSSAPSTGLMTARSPSAMPSSQPSTRSSSPPSMDPSSASSSQPSALPSSAPTPECQDYSVFDKNMFSFYDFGRYSVKIIVRGILIAATLEEATCDALKEKEDELQIDIVSCCTSAVLTVLTEETGGGRRLQLNSTNTTNTTYTAEFNTNVVYLASGGAICNNTCQVTYANAIESGIFGDIIQGSVVELEQMGSKSSKSGSSGGSKTKRSKSGDSSGTMKSGTMKTVASGGTMKSGASNSTMKSGASRGKKKSGGSGMA